MNYVEALRQTLDGKLNMPAEYEPLLDMYTLLTLTVGVNCTREHVHDAWSLWQTKTHSNHHSIVRFDDLPPGIQDVDEEYRVAIVEVAEMCGVGDE